jgi:hypothetical protein
MHLPSLHCDFPAEGAFPGKVPEDRIDFLLHKAVTGNSSQFASTLLTVHPGSPNVAFRSFADEVHRAVILTMGFN